MLPYDTQTARDIRNGMVESDLPVQLRGEDLDKILWRNEQWAVTEFGLECLDGLYNIEKDRFFDDVKPGYLGWPEHMSHKTWVRMDQFWPAFWMAINLHRKGRPLTKG